jgi:hypothetical protein
MAWGRRRDGESSREVQASLQWIRDWLVRDDDDGDDE